MPSTNLRSLEFILVTAQRSPSNNIKSKDLEEYDGKLRNAMIECDDDKDVEIDANEYNLVVDFDEYGLMNLLIILRLFEMIILLIFGVFNLGIVLKNGKALEHFKESKKTKIRITR
ncbi:10342_t:CDS:2 [Entrophospora sp. SA101]|nr:10342_t:CDS:2 [Entrophospora sp. SA101]CAJ0903894.1 5846_t:CDS:2 [Entrophospora sp. SA101]